MGFNSGFKGLKCYELNGDMGSKQSKFKHKEQINLKRTVISDDKKVA